MSLRKTIKKLLVFVLVLSLAPFLETYAQSKGKEIKGNSRTAAPEFGNVAGITASQLKNYLEFIASDELEGRDTPSRGLDIAAMYIASYLKDWGLKPAGDNGTYFQKFPLTHNRIDGEGSILELNGKAFHYGEDFPADNNAGKVSGKVVYAGYSGWFIKAKNIDPYQGIDIKDKIVVVYNVMPNGITYNDLQGKLGDDYASPVIYAQMKGAKAVITIGTAANLAFWKNLSKNQSEIGDIQFNKQPIPITIPVITASPRLIAALFQGEKIDGANIYMKAWAGETGHAFELNPTKIINLNVSVKTEILHAQNVIGILEGSDPVLKNDYIAIGAHYDHLGVMPDAPGDDKIWNGADDNGSGTVAVMAIAKAMATGQRPKRSFLFIWHAGEEEGLWGSEYFTNHPTVPINQIITQLNIDMIGRAQKTADENHPINKNLSKPGEVFLVGSKMMSSELGEISETVNKSFLNLSFNYKYDDPKYFTHFFSRSDQYSYALKGIPVIYYMDGTHEDYHQASDSIEKIDFVQMEKITRTIFATGWVLANGGARPKLDKPLSLK